MTNLTIISAFWIWQAVCLTFITFTAFQHKRRNDELERKIETLHNALPKKNPIDFRSDIEFRKNVRKMVQLKEKCEQRRATIISMRTSSKYFLRLNDIDPERYNKYDKHIIINTAIRSWNEKPLPFFVGNSSEKWLENEDGSVMQRFLRWNLKDNNACTGVDPAPSNDGHIVIAFTGDYFIYSRVVFTCSRKIYGVASRHRHVTRIRSTSDTRFDPLMINVYQMCGNGDEGRSKVSTQEGIFKLYENDRLDVLIQKEEATILNEGVEIGLFLT